MSFLGFIEDGYTRKFYLAPQPGVHDAVRGEVRPLTHLERAKALNGSDGMAADALQEKIAGVMEKRFVSWSIPMKCSKDNLLRLPSLFHRFWNITCGLDAGDEDPQGQADGVPDEAGEAKNS